MIVNPIDLPEAESRREVRTNLFAMATVYADIGSMPVKLRDMSSKGALAEGPVLPPVGARIRLCRGSLQVTGEVAWCREGRAGLRFEGTVTVADWLPRGRATVPQSLIDEVVHQARVPVSMAPPPAWIDIPSTGVTPIDLMRLKRAVEALAEVLGNDPAVIERHGSQLQILDVVGQTLGKVAINQV